MPQARLCDWLSKTTSQDRWPNWIWALGGRVVEDPASAVDGAAATVRIDVIGYRLRAGNIESAAELALFRHYVVTGY
ncbi:hypothetical protein [uncultured Jatrophihabitans sp.]|uniref:hypothetical protein n=1 Tax=uncultured Jatrophihabitans sp. TaxID=1610747 RepID=UPI0035CA6A20